MYFIRDFTLYAFFIIRGLTFILKMCGSPTGQSAAQRSAAQRRTDQRSGAAERRSGAEERSGGAERRSGAEDRSGGAERRSGTEERSGGAERSGAPQRSAGTQQNNKNIEKSNKTKQTNKNKFKLVWLRGALSQTSLNIFVLLGCLCLFPCVFCLLI